MCLSKKITMTWSMNKNRSLSFPSKSNPNEKVLPIPDGILPGACNIAGQFTGSGLQQLPICSGYHIFRFWRSYRRGNKLECFRSYFLSGCQPYRWPDHRSIQPRCRGLSSFQYQHNNRFNKILVCTCFPETTHDHNHYLQLVWIGRWCFLFKYIQQWRSYALFCFFCPAWI